MKEATGRFAKIIFLFLKGDPYSKAETITSRRWCNIGDGQSLQVSCELKLVGHQKLLQHKLVKLKEV